MSQMRNDYREQRDIVWFEESSTIPTGAYAGLFKDKAEQDRYSERVKERTQDFIYAISPVTADAETAED